MRKEGTGRGMGEGWQGGRMCEIGRDGERERERVAGRERERDGWGGKGQS